MLKDLIARINPRQPKPGEPTYRIALDVGTEYVKAVYIEQAGGVAAIIGVGRAHQDYADMDSGAVANISGVTRCCRQAINQGAVIAGVKPKEAAIGVAGQHVTGVARTVTRERKHPERGLTRRELSQLVAGVKREALREAAAEVGEKLGYARLDLELVNSSIVDLRIDGYQVNNPIDFKGRNVEMTVFMIFAPLVHVGAIRTIAQRLDLDLVGLVAEPFAVAASTFTDEAYELGSLVIDIGGGSTDLALIHRGGIVKTKMFAIGGRAFTKGIANLCRTTLREAEQIKLDYAAGMETSGEIRSIIAADLEIWQEALILALQEIKKGQPLPPRIVVCGGGSGLPGIMEAIASPKLVESGLFAVVPEVKLLRPEDVFGIADPKQFLSEVQDVTPKSIAFQASLIEGRGSTILGGVQQG
ncbi:MAG: cell division protein FtsA [Firmicutes bacterium]|jgi:cell division protein FtsA|nr:cell division FtsA domain-containing protein [Bacillota bacterium]NLL88397.1 cell division protein FtsA [Bacillota bacterium]HKM18193.1 cell division FtsA domain-containing protein [Limnochordia bacterium]